MKNLILAILLTFFIIFPNPIFSEDVEEYALSDSPYGLTFDGSNFWYIDSKRRALYKIDEFGKQEVFNLGVPKLTGITFDSREGRIFVASSRLILKVEPNTGGVTDRIHIPIDKIGGVASVAGVLYILNSENGKVVIYDKATEQIIGGFFSDRSEPKDICYGKESLWISDSTDGNIYRYNIETGKITGSVKSPGKDIRGLVFIGSKLWIVDKEEKKAKRINYIETDRFIASLEKEFHIEVELNFSLNEPSIAGGELAILFPPTTEHQRVRNVKSSDERFQVNTTEFETRSLIKSLIIGDTTGKQSLKYSFSVRTQNIRYYITDEYLAKKESITSDLHSFQKFPEAAKGKNTTFFLNKLFDGRLYSSNLSSLSSNLLTNGFPVKPAMTIKFDSQGNSKIYESLNSYILNFGWIPINEVKLSSGETSRSFVKSETTVDLVHSINFEILKSPLF
ncbi:MAG: hypothetical protein HUU45_12230, partial [Leptospiraceae bacterium]|nr:hypothetical protein [Leptospiraceae bacterium]